MSVATLNGKTEVRFASLRASTLFPGRHCLYIHEVARALSTSEQHVIDLTESGDLDYVDIRKRGSRRQCRRIPVSNYDAFILKGGNRL